MFNLRALFGGRAGQRQAAEPSVLVTVECPWAGRQIRRMGTVSELLEQRSLDELVRLLAATQDGAAYLLPAEYTLRVRTAQDENFRAAVGGAPATSYLPPVEAGAPTVHLRIQVAPAWTDSSRPRATALSVSEEEIAAAEATEAPAPVTVPEDGTPAAHVMAAAAQEGLGMPAPPPPAAVDAAIEEAAAEQQPAPAMEPVAADPVAEQPPVAEEPAEGDAAMPTLAAEPVAEETPATPPAPAEPEPAMPVVAEEPVLPIEQTPAPAIEPELEQIAAQAAAEVAAADEPPAQPELTMPVVAAEPPARRHRDQAMAIPGAAQPADTPAAESRATGYIRKSDALRAQLQPKIDALDFSGLFVGNFGRRPDSQVKSPRVALISPAEANKYLMLANQHRRDGENEKAAHYYRTLITHYPENEDYWFLLGKTQEALGDIRQAVHALQNAQRLGHAGAREEIARLEAEHGVTAGSRPDLLKMWRDDFTAQEPPAGES